MNEADRELLELAAKGADQERSFVGTPWSNARGRTWDPLNDDGDALRLAVKMKMRIAFDSLPAGFVMVYPADRDTLCTQLAIEADPHAAARRAIVHAAAEIGKAR